MSGNGDRRSGADRRGGDGRKAGSNRRTGGDRRRETRIKKRIPCEFAEGDKHIRGFILDVSPKGLFVQTHKPITPGGEVSISFTPPNFGRTIDLRASVVRNVRVPPHLASITPPGVGLRIDSAAADYFEFLTSLYPHNDATSAAGAKPSAAKVSKEPKPTSKPKSDPKPAPKPKLEKRKLPSLMPESEASYRVRTKQKGGNRTRSMVMTAVSREHAEAQALEEIGGDWEIVTVEVA